MRRTLIGAALAGLLVAGVSGASQRPQLSQNIELQAAIRTETVSRDLRAAIAQYRAIFEKYAKSDRAVAAEALLRLAECHRKQGDRQVESILDRLIREFGEQPAAAEARTRLERLRSGASLPATFASRVLWTVPEGAAIHGKMSPDGRYVPFGNEDLFLHDLVTGSNRRLTATPARTLQHAEYAEGSAFSRDGQQLAYAWRLRGRDIYQLRVVSLEGEGLPRARVIVDNPDIQWMAPYDWTPDNRTIAVLLRRRDGSAQIATVSAETGALRPLKSIEWRGVSNLALSPDGRRLAFDLQPAGALTRDLFLLAVDGSSETTLVRSASEETLVGWSADGAQVLYLSDRTGSVDLWSVGAEAGTATGEPALLKRDVGQFWPMGLSQAGVAYGAAFAPPFSGKLKLIRLVGGDRRPKDDVQVLDEFVGPGVESRWSHDGRMVATASQWAGTRPLTPRYLELVSLRLVIRTVATGDARELRPSLSYINNFFWANDDQSLIVAGGEERLRGIYRVDIRSGAATPLLRLGEDEQAILAGPRAEQNGIVYFKVNRIAGRETEAARFAALDLASGTQRELIPFGPRSALDVVGVVDGRLVTAQASAGTEALVISALDGSDQRELLRLNAPETFAPLGVQPQPRFVWTPDLQALVVATGAPCPPAAAACQPADLWRIPLKGAPERLGSRPDTLRTARAVGWMSSGRSLVLVGTAGSDSRGVAWEWDLDGAPRKLEAIVDAVVRYPVLSPDGTSLVYGVLDTRPSRSLEVISLHNFLPVKAATSSRR